MMTPQELNAAYEDTLRHPATSQESFQTALAAVKAAQALYESMPAAIYSLGTFAVQAGQMIVVDAFGSAQYGVRIPSVCNGIWQAFVGVEAGVHVALFAYYGTAVPGTLSTPTELSKHPTWVEVGSVPIDTATCAIADRQAYAPLEVEKWVYQIAGIGSHLCFSNTANADGHYPVFGQSAAELVNGVYVQFAPLT